MLVKFVVALCVAAVLANVASAVRITVKNNCKWPLWPATKTGVGRELSTTGFMLGPGAARDLDVPHNWEAGRIWARTQCDHPSGRCVTGDCGSGAGPCNGRTGATPATLAEFTLNDRNGKDSYDVSYVDGANVPMSIIHQGGHGSNCKNIYCNGDVNRVCPNELALRTPDGVVGCWSGCEKFKTDELCCRGRHNTRATCPPTKWSRIFKDVNPMGYSYAYDDPGSLYDCYGSPNYVVTFCP